MQEEAEEEAKAFVLEVAAQATISKLVVQELLVLVIEALVALVMVFIMIQQVLLEQAKSQGRVIMQAACFEAI